jgi:predicted Zn-dependent protease
MPDRELAAWLVSQGRADEALPNLQRLDAMEERDPAYAIEVARILRSRGDAVGAMRSAEKAARVDGYDPATRELAAAIAIEAGELPTAMRHLEALQRLEPGQARHAQRIERLRSLMDQAAAPASRD